MEPTDEAVEAVARKTSGREFLWDGLPHTHPAKCDERDMVRATISAYLATPEAQAMVRDARRWKEFLKRARVISEATEYGATVTYYQLWGAWFTGELYKHVNHAIDAAIEAREVS